jgi:nuclear GTP-binding protein
MGKPGTLNKKSNNPDNPNRVATKNGQRSKSTIMRLNMYRRGAPVRNKDGKIIGGTLLMNNKSGGKDIEGVARIAPDRRWFGNTRTISQNDLDKFRDEMTTKEADPYSIILKRQKIPIALLKDSEKVAKVNLLETEGYDRVFGGKQNRKRPKLSESLEGYAALAQQALEKQDAYETSGKVDSNIEVEEGRERDVKKEDLFSKGQSKRKYSCFIKFGHIHMYICIFVYVYSYICTHTYNVAFIVYFIHSDVQTNND